MTTQACIVTSEIVKDLDIQGVTVDNSRNYAIVQYKKKNIVEVFSTDSGLTMIESLSHDQTAYNTNKLFIKEAIEEWVQRS